MYRTISAMLIAALSALPALSAPVEHKFTLSIAGLSVASVALTVDRSGDGYDALARVRGRGLVGSFVELDYEGHSEGRFAADGRPKPLISRSQRRDDEGGRAVVIHYSGGTPVSVTADPPWPPRPWDIAPLSQRGTLDPISAAVAIIADRPVGEACGRTVEIFDGRRRSRVVLGARSERGNFWICPGTYSRVAGYPPKRMEEQVDFPFEITYQETNGILRVVRIDMESTFGSARMQRR